MKSCSQTMALLLLSLLLITAINASATNYYFSTSSGDDSRSFEDAQNQATPWKTIDKLNEVFGRLEPGDSILFKRGENFKGGILVDRPGTASLPIVFSAYGQGSRPVISGFTKVTNWTSIGGGIYESDVLPAESSVNMVVINGVNYAKGRFPNADATNSGYLTIESAGGQSITDSKFPNPANFEGGQIVLRTSNWTIERRRITSQSATKISYDDGTAYDLSPGFGYFIQDHFETLDQYGEWYYNPDSKKIAIYFGAEGPDEFAEVKVSTIDVLITPRASHFVIDNLILEGANKFGMVYEGYDGLEDMQILNSEIRFSGIDAAYLIGWAHFRMENSAILNSNNCALKLEGHDPYSVIRNNLFKNTGVQPGMGGDGDGNYAALFSTSKGLIAEYNTIINTGYVGIRFANEDNLIKNNYIDHFCTIMDDGSGIYTYDSRGASGAGYDRKVIGNIVLNGIGEPNGTPSLVGAAEGIYLDDNSLNIEVTGNTVGNCGSRGIFIHNAQEFMISRNTIFNNSMQFSTVHDQHGDAITGAVIKDNIFFSKDVGQPAAHLKSKNKDFSQMGEFKNNYYVRPFDDNLTIHLEYETGEGARVNQPYTLEDWQQFYGKDEGSKKSPVNIKPYQLDHVSDVNQVSNGTFNDNIVGTWCSSSVSSCLTNWIESNVVGQGVLEIGGQGPSTLGINSGPMKANKYYVLRFVGAAKEEANIEVYLRQSEWPWDVMAAPQAAKLSTEKQEYELLFMIPNDEAAGSLQFGVNDQGVKHWIDNIEFREADAMPTSSESYIRFEYNPSKENKTIALDADYIDVREKKYTGSIELRPFESLILLRDPESTTNPDQDPDTDPNVDPDEGTNPDEEPSENPTGEPDPDTDPNPGTDPDNPGEEEPNPNPDTDPDNPGEEEPNPNPDTDPDNPGEEEPNPNPDTDPDNPGEEEPNPNPDTDPDNPGEEEPNPNPDTDPDNPGEEEPNPNPDTDPDNPGEEEPNPNPDTDPDNPGEEEPNPNPDTDPDNPGEEEPNPNPDTDPDNPGEEEPNPNPDTDPDNPGEEEPNPNPDTDPDNPGEEEPNPNPDPDPSTDPDQEPDSNPDPDEEKPTRGGHPSSPYDKGYEDRMPFDKVRTRRSWPFGNSNNRYEAVEEPRDWTIYPNPVSTANPELAIEFYSETTDRVNIFVIDQLGRKVKVLSSNAEQGLNKTILDTSNLRAGMYYVIIPDALTTEENTKPFVVIRN